MEYNQIYSTATKGNTGAQLAAEDFGAVAFLILTDADFSVTVANAMLYATWENAINAEKAQRIYPLPAVFDVTYSTEETVFQTSGTGVKEKVRDGKKTIDLPLKGLSLYNHTQLKTHETRKNLAVYEVTQNGYIKGWTDGTNLYPFAIDELSVTRSGQTGSELERTMLSVTYSDVLEYELKGAQIKPTAFNPVTKLLGIRDVKIAVTSPTVSGATVTVTGAADNFGIEGLTKPDFILVDDAGGAETITTVTEVGDGVYTFAWTLGADGYLLNLVNQPDMLVKFFESIGATTFTVSA